MSYYAAYTDEKNKELAYRIYVTDSLQAVGQNKYLTTRWIDFIKKPQAIDNRSADEIALDVITRLGLTFRNEGGE